MALGRAETILRAFRENASYALGFGLAIHQAIVRHGQDPAIIALIGVLLGVMPVIQGDRRREHKREDE